MSGEAEKTERAYVYMVRCAGGQLYTGWTNDPASRLHAHKSGKGAKCTRALGAQRFAYLERCTDKSAALRREAALKKLTKEQKETLCAEWAEKSPGSRWPPGPMRRRSWTSTTGMSCTIPPPFR